MHTHIVTQQCLVTVFNVTYGQSKEKQNYDGLSFISLK